VWEDAAPVPTAHRVDREAFERDIVPGERPMIFRGLVDNWTLTKAGRTSPQTLCDLLATHATRDPVEAWRTGPDQNGRFGYSADLSDFNFTREPMPFSALMKTLLEDDKDTVFAGAIPLPQIMPRLARDLPMPLLDSSEERLTSLWIGNGSATPAHWDLARNLACVISGKRRFIVMPPEQLPNLYVGPIDRTLAGQPSSLVDFDAPDFDAHPRFSDAVPHAQIAHLEPGDALYLPSMWWHHVTTPPPFGAQVNFWWRASKPHMVTPLFTLYHALLTLRDLPSAERRAWHAHFDHYIFGDDNGVAHLPPAQRGVLGETTPLVAEAIRQFVISSLRD
jgi:Cupin-like domain